MTCFWDGILQSLDNNDFNKLNISKTHNIKNLIQLLKKKNTVDINITWNNEKLTTNQLHENFQHIKNYNENSIYSGYDCSFCDPFLILICHLFSLEIHHNYIRYMMIYKSIDPKKLINYGSNSGHFYFISTKNISSTCSSQPPLTVKPTIQQAPEGKPTIQQAPEGKPTIQQAPEASQAQLTVKSMSGPIVNQAAVIKPTETLIDMQSQPTPMEPKCHQQVIQNNGRNLLMRQHPRRRKMPGLFYKRHYL